ncbi:hypothetical protein FHG87_001409 [Trinorchestia longiramus]|nr:hypothetical protein FHG87_001409 [Trinorchestia longiramus]
MKNFAIISILAGVVGVSIAANIGVHEHAHGAIKPVVSAQVAQSRSAPASETPQTGAQSPEQQVQTYIPAYVTQARTPARHQQPSQTQHVTPTVQTVRISSIQPTNAPHHQPQLGVSVSAYQPQNTGNLVVYDGNKSKLNEKKPVPGVKDIKPVYYPKDSSYSTVPVQVEEKATARFVADPTRGHLVEELSPAEVQQLSLQQSHPYTLVSQPMQMPGHNFNYVAAVPGTTFQGMAGVHGMVPVRAVQAANPQFYNSIRSPGRKTETVTYEKTEHGFIDRVWGEVQTMRQAITTDFFGAVPTFFRNIWDAIVGAVSPSTTARMLSSVNWMEVARFVVEQLS